MIELTLLHYIVFFFIVTLQTMVGVGVLVLGTPILLILNFEIINIISILLPISIFTSFFNLVYFRIVDKISLNKLGGNIKNYFFTICIPAIIIGLLLLKFFQNIIDFKIFVAIIIFFSLILKKYYKNNLVNINVFKKKLLLFIIGLVHGLSNSGGTLLSILILKIYKNSKNITRYNLTFFYFFLAIMQYLIFIIIFQKLISIDLILILLFVVLTGISFGNYFIKFIKKYYFNLVIEILALLSGIFLILTS